MQKQAPLAANISQKKLINRLLDTDYMRTVFQENLSTLTEEKMHVKRCKSKLSMSRDMVKKNQLKVIFNVETEGQGNLTLIGQVPGQNSSGFFHRELNMSFHFFPDDSSLPALEELIVSRNSTVLQPHISSNITNVHYKIKHYRPNNRCVLKATLNLSDNTKKVVYIKIFFDERGEVQYENLKKLWTFSKQCRSFQVPEALGYDRNRRMLVMSEAYEEEDLSTWIKCLEDGDPLPSNVTMERVENCMATVAQGLTELNHSNIEFQRKSNFLSALEHCHKDANLYDEICPELTSEVREVLNLLEKNQPKEEVLAPCHGGFRHKQMIGNDHSLTIIDWDGAIMANPARDAASFLVRLRKEPLFKTGIAEEMEHLAAVFRREFLMRNPHLPENHLNLYESLILTDKALRAFRRPYKGNHALDEIKMYLTQARRIV